MEDTMSEPGLVDITGRTRSPAATPGHGAGCAPPNKGLRYPADPPTVVVLVRSGKGGKRRMVGMDDWAWEHVARWTEHRVQLPIGPLFCILAGPTRGRGWSATAARGELRRLAAQAGVRRRFAPHQLRHAHAIEMAHEGIPLPIIQRQLGHAHLGITSVYLQGIDTREIVDTIHHRRPPVIPASAGLRP
jgi:integrase/recombinase XerD